MWIVFLICIPAISFLLICLRGFRNASRQPSTLQVVYTTEEKQRLAAPRKARLIIFPRRVEKVHYEKLHKAEVFDPRDADHNFRCIQKSWEEVDCSWERKRPVSIRL